MDAWQWVRGAAPGILLAALHGRRPATKTPLLPRGPVCTDPFVLLFNDKIMTAIQIVVSLGGHRVETGPPCSAWHKTEPDINAFGGSKRQYLQCCSAPHCTLLSLIGMRLELLRSGVRSGMCN